MQNVMIKSWIQALGEDFSTTQSILKHKITSFIIWEHFGLVAEPLTEIQYNTSMQICTVAVLVY